MYPCIIMAMAKTTTTRSGPTDPDDYIGQKRAVDTRLAILQQGARLFSAKGFEGCSTREIATAAGVSHANVRYHFGDKETLWLKVVQHLLAEAYQGKKIIDDIKSGSSIVQNFREHTRNAIRYFAYHPELPRIILFEKLTNSDRLNKIKSVMSEAYEQRFESIRVMQEASLIKDIDTRLLNEVVEGALAYKFVISTDIDRQDTEELDRLIDEYTDVIVQLVQYEK